MEFAIAAPILLLILFGIMGWGGYFWRAHALQQAANDAARAAIGGLTATERATIARDAARIGLAELGGIDPARAQVSVAETGATIRVAVRYDGQRDAFLRLGLVPLPGRAIERSASVRLGGL